MTTETKNFSIKINGNDVDCELEQWTAGDQVVTRLNVGGLEIENSTGGSDCYLDIENISEASAQDYAAAAVAQLLLDAADVIKMVDSGEESDNASRLGMTRAFAGKVVTLLG